MNIKKRGIKANSRFQMDNLDKIVPISKRSQSQIITTVLLILLGVIAAGVIMTFIIPFIKEKLQSGDCLDVVNKIEIRSGYTCYDGTTGSEKVNVQIHILDISDLITGFKIEFGGTSSKIIEIVDDTDPTEEIKMYDDGKILIPGNNEARTYNITYSSRPDFIAVYPTLNSGKTCPASDSVVDIEDC